MDEKTVIPLTLPFNCLLVAESGAGKTSILTRLLTDKQRFLNRNPSGLCLLYSTYQKEYELWSDYFDNVITREGIPASFSELLPPLDGGWIVIADDLQKQTCSSDEYLKLITAGRHMNISATFTVWHTLFPSCKNSRILAQNFHTYFLLKSSRLVNQIGFLGGQLGFSQKALKNVYLNATHLPYSYLLIDMSNRALTDKRLMLRANCLNESVPCVCYAIHD